MIKFLTVGRVLYDKGFAELVECATYYKARGIEAEFQWLGAIDEDYSQFVSREEVQKFQDKGIINYLGYSPDVRKYIKDTDCIILPSYHEGMSRVLMESLAMRKPIITTNIPGCKETVIDSVNGFLCEPKNSESLIQAVRKFLDLSPQQRVQMGIRSREYAEKRFDIKNVIDIYDKLVESILKN